MEDCHGSYQYQRRHRQIVANTNLAKSQSGSWVSRAETLSSGLRINSGADDPSGLIASETLKSEIQGISTAIDNSTQASNVISTADAALGEVSNLLVSIKSLVVQAANTGALSPDEIQANQLQVDSAVASITRISNSTSFAGLKLLDGSLGYITSGMATSALARCKHQQRGLWHGHATIPVAASTSIQSAQPAAAQIPGFRPSPADVTTSKSPAPTGVQEHLLRLGHQAPRPSHFPSMEPAIRQASRPR